MACCHGKVKGCCRKNHDPEALPGPALTAKDCRSDCGHIPLGGVSGISGVPVPRNGDNFRTESASALSCIQDAVAASILTPNILQQRPPPSL